MSSSNFFEEFVALQPLCDVRPLDFESYSTLLIVYTACRGQKTSIQTLAQGHEPVGNRNHYRSPGLGWTLTHRQRLNNLSAHFGVE